MKILDESTMEKKVEEEKFDLLDLLRTLNENNINENTALRDDLFSSISVVPNLASFSNKLTFLSDIGNTLNGNIKRVNGKVTTVEISGDRVLEEFSIMSALTLCNRHCLKFKDNYILIDFDRNGYNKPDFWTFIVLIRIENIIKKDPKKFQIFKFELTSLLIKLLCEKYSTNITNPEYKTINIESREKLNKLMVILSEQLNELEPSKIYPKLLTNELINRLMLEKDSRNHGQIVIDYVMENYIIRFTQEQAINSQNEQYIDEPRRPKSR